MQLGLQSQLLYIMVCGILGIVSVPTQFSVGLKRYPVLLLHFYDRHESFTGVWRGAKKYIPRSPMSALWGHPRATSPLSTALVLGCLAI